MGETFRDAHGNEFKISLIKNINHNNELEVRVEAAGLPRLDKNSNPLLGFGRDIDDNGKIDTWFFITKNGMELIEKEGEEELGRDVLGELLKKKYTTNIGMYASSMITSLFSYLLFSVNESLNIEEEFYQNWMDLEESRLQFEREMNELGGTSTVSERQFQNELLSIGFKDLAAKMENFGKKTFFGYAFMDLGLWISGGVVFNWGAKILAKVGLLASETALINGVKETFFSFFEKQKEIVQNRINILQEKMRSMKIQTGMKVAEKELTLALTVATWKKVVSLSIKSRKIKNKLRLSLNKTVKWPVAVLESAKSEWKYITMNTGVQVGAELYARYDDVYDKDPVQMAKNLMANPDVVQNVSFMASETILMTGLSKNMKTMKARFMVSGVVAITNSSFTNLVIRENKNTERVVLDTAWETIVGNAQVQLDLKGLEYFEKMAQKKNNPKIKLLGYAIALIDMGVGYVGYSKATSTLIKKENIILVPILAEN